MEPPLPSKSAERAAVLALFRYPCHSYIVRAALEGHMGSVTVRGASADGSLAARVQLGVFSVLAGAPSAELVKASSPSAIVVVESTAHPDWAALLETYLPRHRPYTRYAMHGDSQLFDVPHLQRLVAACPAGYTIAAIDEAAAEKLACEDWSSDLTGNFASPADFCRRGLGFVATVAATGEIAAGASSFAVCDAGIELEVDTAAAHQRRGLARVCAARLLLECRARGWRVSWDAHVPHSAALAEQLGYTAGTAYVAYTSDPRVE